MNLRQIDLQKRKIEAKYIKPIRAIFKQMDEDAVNLYKATGNIPADQIARTYTPEFTKVVRDAMRESIIKFGFLQRDDLKIKNTKSLDLQATEDELSKLNEEFAKEAVLFIATESERQALYIQNTNSKELTEAQQNAIISNSKKQARLQTIIQELTAKINQIRFGSFVRGEIIAPESVARLNARLEKYQRQLNEMQKNQKTDIAKNIQENLQAKEEWRSELIAEMSVGIAESWARNQEVATLAIVLAEQGISLKKRWQTILDGRERPTHHAASGQTVGINEKFIVGGARANYPRDPNLPMAELANCRCGVEYIK